MFRPKRKDPLLALLTRMAHNVERSGTLLYALAESGERTPAAWRELWAVQRDGHRQLMGALAGTLFPPLDGQDLFALSLRLGRLLHEVTGAAGSLEFSARPPAADVVQLAARVQEALRETSRAVDCLARRERSGVVGAARRLYRLQDGGREGPSGGDVESALDGIVFSCTELVLTIQWVLMHNS